MSHSSAAPHSKVSIPTTETISNDHPTIKKTLWRMEKKEVVEGRVAVWGVCVCVSSKCPDKSCSINQWRGHTSRWLESSYRELLFISSARLAPEWKQTTPCFLWYPPLNQIQRVLCAKLPAKPRYGPTVARWTLKIPARGFRCVLQSLGVNGDRIRRDTWVVLK